MNFDLMKKLDGFVNAKRDTDTIESWPEFLARSQPEFPPGPWQSEPVHAVFAHAGLNCYILLNPMLVYCGYVAVPKDHPWHGKAYQDAEGEDVPSHGGLTFAGNLRGLMTMEPITTDEWAFGFDCCHIGDYSPVMIDKEYSGCPKPLWRNFEYVKGIVMELAEFLAKKGKSDEKMSKMPTN